MKLPVLPKKSNTYDAIGIGLNAIDEIILISKFPKEGSKIEFSKHFYLPGGPAASTIVALSRLGLKTKYVGNVGNDKHGQFQLNSLNNEGVEYIGNIIEGADTLVAFIIVNDKTGERTCIWRQDPKTTIKPDQISEDIISSSRVIHLDGRNTEAEIIAAGFAKQMGIPVCLDAETYSGANQLFPLVDYLIASSEFIYEEMNCQDERKALAKLHNDFGCPFVAVTLGDKGSLALCNGVYFETPAFDINVVDTIGAGDAFHAGFLYGLLIGLEVEETLKVSNVSAH